MPDADEHGIDDAFYANGPWGTSPILRCMCGFETSTGNDLWTEAGQELDEHLAPPPKKQDD